MGISGKFLKNSQAAYLSFAENTLTQLDDPECPQVGETFISKLADSGCKIVDSETAANTQSQKDASRPAATYTSFNYYVENVPSNKSAFVNRIVVNDDQDKRHATISLTHEGLHVEQWNIAPVLHASPFNGRYSEQPSIVVCPSDWAKLFLLTEGDAFAKQAWMSSLAAHQDDQFIQAAKANPVTPEKFDEIRKSSIDLKQTLVKTANEALNNWHHKNKISSKLRMKKWGVADRTSFGEYYTGYALDMYEGSLRLQNPTDITFVRMEQSDMVLAGETIGPNILQDSNFSGNNNLHSFIPRRLQKKIMALNEKFGIASESDLPTFKQALKAIGHTPESYLAWSKNPYGSPAAPALNA